MERTHKWAVRCLKAHRRTDQALFGIVQGGFNPDWRRESARFLLLWIFPVMPSAVSVWENPRNLLRK